MNISMTNINKYPAVFNNRNIALKSTIIKQPSFTGIGGETTKVASKFFDPIKKVLKPLTDKLDVISDKSTHHIAKAQAWLLGTKPAKAVIEFTNKNDLDVVKHLSSFIGLIIAGLYIQKTMTNEKLDPEKRVTLSINQGIVAAVATTLGYSVDGVLGKQVDKFARKFSAIHYKADPGDLKMLKGGIRAASSMMVFGMMYRYVAPVLVTPIANKIGNNIHDKNVAKQKAEKGLDNSAQNKTDDKTLSQPQVVTSAVAFANAPAAGVNRPILQNLMATQKFS